MTAHLYIPSLDTTDRTPISLSENVVSGLLSKEMGFNGLKFTDGLIRIRVLLEGESIRGFTVSQNLTNYSH